jgi:hypothetical protein
MRLFQSSGVAPVTPRWFNPLDSAAIDAQIAAGGYFAWRAQANDNITWGAGPANYAASLISVEGNAAALVEGNGAVAWAQPTGWSLTRALSQYFITGITPANNQNWLMFIQFDNFVWIVDFEILGGMSSGANRYFWLEPGRANVNVVYCNGGARVVAPQQASGNLAIIGPQGYRNGVVDGPPCAVWGGASSHPIIIGGLNNSGAPMFYVESDIHAAVICGDATAITAADRAAIAALPAGSMHNL